LFFAYGYSAPGGAFKADIISLRERMAPGPSDGE
jgi:hypothetical protein